MRKCSSLFFCLICTCLLVLAGTAAHAENAQVPKLHLQSDDNIVITRQDKNGKPEEIVTKINVWETATGSTRRVIRLDAEAKERYGLEPGIYFFEADGKFSAMFPMEDAVYMDRVGFSPKGDIVSISCEAFTLFFTYPDMKPLGEATPSFLAEPFFLWNDNQGILFSNGSSLDTEDGYGGRTCNYDPCGPISVYYYSFKDQKEKELLQGTTECDYILKEFDPAKNEMEVIELCLASGKAWFNFPSEELGKPIQVPFKEQ